MWKVQYAQQFHCSFRFCLFVLSHAIRAWVIARSPYKITIWKTYSSTYSFGRLAASLRKLLRSGVVTTLSHESLLVYTSCYATAQPGEDSGKTPGRQQASLEPGRYSGSIPEWCPEGAFAISLATCLDLFWFIMDVFKGAHQPETHLSPGGIPEVFRNNLFKEIVKLLLASLRKHQLW